LEFHNGDQIAFKFSFSREKKGKETKIFPCFYFWEKILKGFFFSSSENRLFAF